MKTSMWEHFRKNAGWYVAGLIVVLLVIASFFVWCFWDWLRMVPHDYESGTATVRNLGLLVTAIIALPLGIWRSFVAHRQAETAQQGLLNERYQKGAEMLGSEVLSVRLGGIYALARLAEEHPEQYHVPIIQLFCTFVRNLTRSKESQDKQEDQSLHKSVIREDIQAVMTAIGSRSETGLGCEKATKSFGLEIQHSIARVTVSRRAYFWLDLRGANLRGVDLCEANLSSANFSGADLSNSQLLEANLSNAILTSINLSNAMLFRANLSGADLNSANLSNATLASANLSRTTLAFVNLSNAELSGANLSDAEFTRVNLTGANLSGVTGLTQSELNRSCAIPDKPPRLNNAFDAKTGNLLEWRGGLGR